MLKSEVTPGFKSLCRDSQPITSMSCGDELPQSIIELFGDELPQSIRELFGDELPQSIRELFGDELPQSIRELFGDELPQSIRELFGDELPQSIRELFGDELPQSIRDISQVERMVAKCVNSSNRKGHGQQFSQSYNKRRNYGESRSSDRSRNWRDYSLNS